MSELVEQISKKTIPPHVKSLVLEMCVNGRDGEDVDVGFEVEGAIKSSSRSPLLLEQVPYAKLHFR
jgi:hypothetical protein